MKKTMSILLVTALVCLALPILAEEGDAGVLTWPELNQFVESLTETAKTLPVQAGDGEPDNDESAGYALAYDFGTIYCDRPQLDEDAVINEIVITSPDFPGIRGISVNSSLGELLAAFYNENDNLTGDKSFAGLYAGNFLPDYAVWAWVQRDGQNVQSVQYAIHEELASGGDGYSDCGIIYTIQDDYVSAIRIYGLSSAITKEDVEENLRTIEDLMTVDAYERVASARQGDEVLPFGRQDLIFEGIDFATVTPEIAESVFGTPVEDEWMDDGENGFIRVMDFSQCSITFTTDRNRENPQIYMLYIADNLMEGPRGIRVGDYLSDVIDRFPSGEGEFDGSSEVLYGSEESGIWGTAQYAEDGTASTYYQCSFNGMSITLFVSYSTMAAEEIMIIFG